MVIRCHPATIQSWLWVNGLIRPDIFRKIGAGQNWCVSLNAQQWSSNYICSKSAEPQSDQVLRLRFIDCISIQLDIRIFQIANFALLKYPIRHRHVFFVWTQVSWSFPWFSEPDEDPSPRDEFSAPLPGQEVHGVHFEVSIGGAECDQQ